MTKQEFLTTLMECLAGNVPSDVIDDNVKYYREYIEQSGQSEDDVLLELGDPHLIARTIIDSFMAQKGPMADFYAEQARNEYRNMTDDTDESGESSNYSQQNHHEYFRGVKWYEKLLGILIIVAVVALVFVIGSIAVGIFIRIILPIIVVFLIVKLIIDHFGRG